ncbi:MAG: Ycf51 family protein [Hormoscilla sp. GM7CHS1pb]|nr:Ycf51 family protein [Hormoscilla sp. GM7CHS1pb]
MPTTALFVLAAKWVGIATAVCAVVTVLSWVLKWGIRFRLVGVTSFMVILTAGLFTLSIAAVPQIKIPGAVPFSLVYDNGAAQTAIAVPPEITEPQLEATLRQAAYDLFSPGRGSSTSTQLTIRARTIIHPEENVSKPLYLGYVKRSLRDREDDNMEIFIDSEKLASLPKLSLR